jgi:hypothetical protein
MLVHDGLRSELVSYVTNFLPLRQRKSGGLTDEKAAFPADLAMMVKAIRLIQRRFKPSLSQSQQGLPSGTNQITV